nr:hypothetical protein [Frigoriglobus tundricola]
MVLLRAQALLGGGRVRRGADRVRLDHADPVPDLRPLPADLEELRVEPGRRRALVAERRLAPGNLLPGVGQPRLVVPQPLFAARHLPVQFLRPLFELLGLRRRAGHLGLERGERRLLAPERPGQVEVLAHAEPDPQLAQPVGVLLVLLRLRGLHPERAELGVQRVELVLRAGEVQLDGGELAERFVLFRFEPADARGLVEDLAAVLRGRLEQLVHAPLGDDRVAAGGTAAEEQVLDVLEAGHLAVDEVLAGAVAVHAAGELHVVGVDAEQPAGVIERDRHLGHAEALAGGGPVEDDVGHFAAAEALGRLLAEQPAHRVHDVALTGPVRPDHPGDARREVEPRLVRERLEAHEFEALEHGRTVGSGQWAVGRHTF